MPWSETMFPSGVSKMHLHREQVRHGLWLHVLIADWQAEWNPWAWSGATTLKIKATTPSTAPRKSDALSFLSSFMLIRRKKLTDKAAGKSRAGGRNVAPRGDHVPGALSWPGSQRAARTR